MSPIAVIITIIAYFALLIGISWFASRKSDNSTFFTGGKKAPWLLVAIAMMGAPISGVTFISVPGMVTAKGYSYMQMALGFIVGYFVIAYILIPMFYRRNLISIYGYLGERFGLNSHRTGAWFFLISKLLGAAVRFYVVCAVLQLLVYTPLGIPFIVNVIIAILLIWLYTFRGGVKSIIWTDAFKSFCLVASVVLCIYFIAKSLDFSFTGMISSIAVHDTSRIFFFDNPMEGTYFWKQFIAGIFMVIAMTGLDQDMMQRTLASSDYRQSQKGLVSSVFLQVLVIFLFLVLGTLLVMYMQANGIAAPEKSDDIFGTVAAGAGMPLIVGVLFVLGLISAAYSAAGSALTSLTTSFTVDILKGETMESEKLSRTRKWVHIAMSAAMAVTIIIFYYASSEDAISAVYAIASYTYGPILGLFAFGLSTKRRTRDGVVPAICIISPILAGVLQWGLKAFAGYTMGFELLLVNALFTVIGLYIFSSKPSNDK